MWPDLADLAAVIILTAAGMGSAFLASGDPLAQAVRAVVILPLVLLLPGYALVAALFPSSRPDTPEGFMLPFGGSMIVAIMTGLVLNGLGLGLGTTPWALSLGGLTFAAVGIASLRRLARRRAGTTGPAGAARRHQWAHTGLGIRGVLLLTVAAVVVIGAVQLSKWSEANQIRPGFTQMWALTEKESGTVVHLNIRNLEGKSMSYRLLVTQSGQILDASLLLELADGATWSEPVTLRPEDPNEVQAELYSMDAPDTVYRQVVLYPGQSGQKEVP